MNDSQDKAEAARVERAARALADEYNYGWVFERDHSEPYDADYWRHIARKVLAAAGREP